MNAVEDMRFCPWEGQTLPVDHDCIAAADDDHDQPNDDAP